MTGDTNSPLPQQPPMSEPTNLLRFGIFATLVACAAIAGTVWLTNTVDDWISSEIDPPAAHSPESK
ncbi:MAG: hypothetical protein HY369_01455 [Candidatus Aenigmarchaeota archaeon]|nr:hypothetical protein [Candidatus Aenigmarchaeota archaeon]